MNRYIHNIQVNKVFHLGGFNIPIEEDNCPHLIITGKNGSGKTSLLNAIADFIEKCSSSVYLIVMSVFLHKNKKILVYDDRRD